ncbi:hypothetical protein AURDEDRAFT_111896 [Auricularia subglabra TFB-10046 SS5]|nr:hypothetical protein AURDEDRAFT_111896 [Auricularia subglabra TFB-10046 SS5]
MEDVRALFGGDEQEDGRVVYGDYQLEVAPKEGRANTLLADQLFSPALLFAEQIELGRVPVAGRTVLELGAGAGLPSLLAVAQGAAKVVASDYPDALILATLRANVCSAGVLVEPYEWGTDPSALLAHTPASEPNNNDTPTEGFDVLLLSDLLHFADEHGALLDSVDRLLRKDGGARVYVAAGRYTKPAVCERFVLGAQSRGLVLDEWEITADAPWEVQSTLKGVDGEGMAARKRNCRMWAGRWAGV